jgi:hypothetical protein
MTLALSQGGMNGAGAGKVNPVLLNGAFTFSALLTREA